MNKKIMKSIEILCCLIIISFAGNVNAETIVRHERYAGRSIQMQYEKVPSDSRKVNNEESIKEDNKIIDSEQIKKSDDKRNNKEYNRNDNEIIKVQIGKTIKDFYAEKPKYTKVFFDSYSALQCEYKLKTDISTDNSPSILIQLEKSRQAGVILNSDIYCSFRIYTFNLIPNAIFSKKHEPFIEKYSIKDVKKIIFRDPSFVTSSAVSYDHLSNKQMEKTFEINNNISYSLVFYNENGDMIKIPLSKEVIEMFNKVVLTDLKKMKKEHDNK